MTLVNIKVGEHTSTHTTFGISVHPLAIALTLIGIAVLLAGAVVLRARRRRRAQVSHEG